MGIGGGGGSPPAPVPPIKPAPPPPQVSASLSAVRGAKAGAASIGDLGGTILGGADMGGMAQPGAALRSPGDVLYGKKLTGA
jgi:hypothetical protein